MSKIALMCGHGRSTDGTWDCGTSYGGNNEAALMLPITKAALKYLRASGVTVISDADTNNNKNMIADVKWANKEKVSIYISLHCDWYKAPTGTLPLYVSAGGKKLATTINNAVMSGMGMKTRGVTKRTDLYELNYTDAPACIFETGSIKADIKKLKDSDKYGKCIAKGICNYLGVTFKESATPTPAPQPAPQTPLYRVRKSWADSKSQIGAYKSLENAKKACDDNKGYYVFDASGNVVYPIDPPKATTYRVRKTWADSKSQVGAYKLLENAKKECDKHAGYSVFDDNGKAVYTSKAVVSTNAQKIVAKANEYAWAYGTASSKYSYSKGSAKSVYKTALKKFMGKSAKISQTDCGYFVSTCVRSAGISSSFLALPASYKNSYPSVPSTMTIVSKGSVGTLKAGDIIRYRKSSGQHTVIYIGDGKIAHASRGNAFPRISATKPWNNSNVKKSTIQVIRAK